MRDLEWACKIEPEVVTAAEIPSQEFRPLIFGGTAIVNDDIEIGKNGWGIPDDELASFYKQFEGASLRKNHGKLVDDIVGRVHEGKYENGAIKFKAEVGDPILADKISRGYIKHVSICAGAKEVVCSVCGKATRPIKACKCKDGHELIRGLKLKELSLVAEPAFESAKIVPLSFSAAVNDALMEKIQEGAEDKAAENIISGDGKMADKTKPSTVSAEDMKHPVEKCEDEAKKEEAQTSRTQTMGTDSIALLAEEVKALNEGIRKMQLFWEEFTKKQEQLFWEQKKEDEAAKKEEEAVKKEEEEEEDEAAKKREEAPPKGVVPPQLKPYLFKKKKEEEEEEDEAAPGVSPEAKKVIPVPSEIKKDEEEEEEEEAAPGVTPIKNIPVPPEITKKEDEEEEEEDEEDEEEDEEASQKKEKGPILQAKTDTSEDTIKFETPLTPEQMFNAAFEEIKRKAKEFEII